MHDDSIPEPGSRVQDMSIREVVTSMASAPFAECQQAIEKNRGGMGAAHSFESSFFNMATAAFQTIPSYREHWK